MKFFFTNFHGNTWFYYLLAEYRKFICSRYCWINNIKIVNVWKIELCHKKSFIKQQFKCHLFAWEGRGKGIDMISGPNLPNIKYKYKYRLKISVKISKINAMRNDLVTLHRGKAGQAKSNISLSRGKTSSRRWKMAQNSF